MASRFERGEVYSRGLLRFGAHHGQPYQAPRKIKYTARPVHQAARKKLRSGSAGSASSPAGVACQPFVPFQQAAESTVQGGWYGRQRHARFFSLYFFLKYINTDFLKSRKSRNAYTPATTSPRCHEIVIFLTRQAFLGEFSWRWNLLILLGRRRAPGGHRAVPGPHRSW